MSFRRAPRRLLILAGLVPLMLGMWSTGGAQAIGSANPATCQDAAGGATPLVDCGGPATHLIFSIQPGDALVNQPLNPQPVVEAVDDSNVVDVNYNNFVTLTIATNPGGGTLHGGNVVQAVNGVATFIDLNIDQPGVGYTLAADAPSGPINPRGVEPALAFETIFSDPFNITLPLPSVRCDTVYGVVDANGNSRFYAVGSMSPYTLTPLGGVHAGDNFEGIEYSPRDDRLYAVTAAGNRHGRKGYLYSVDPTTGALTPLFSTGFKDVEGLSYRFSDNTLWAWADGKGLITIDPANHSATLVLPSQRRFEALGWSPASNALFLARGNELWLWNPTTLAFSRVSSHLPGPVLGLDVRSPFGEMALGVAKQQKIVIWDPVTQTTVGNIPTPGFKPTQSLAWTFACQIPG